MVCSPVGEQGSQHQLPSDLLLVIAEAFPQAFFADPKQVRPLKIHIHHDLKALFQTHALPAELDLDWIKRFLRWYTRRTCYLKSLVRGESRIDLMGADVDGDIPESIRALACQEIARRQALKTGTAGTRKAVQANRAAVAMLSGWRRPFRRPFFSILSRYGP